MPCLSDAVIKAAGTLRQHKTSALFRLAPTPSGYLHRGNLFNFLLNWLTARLSGSRIWLRIDDLDSGRIRPAYLEALFRNLEELGLDWDFGPSGPQDMAFWSQHRRMDVYRLQANCLLEQGYLYACSCSRKDLAEGKPCRCGDTNLSELHDTLLRWKANPASFSTWNDLALGLHTEAFSGGMVVWRRDGLPAYQLASVADDAHFGVTHVWRGADLLPSTAFQLQLMATPCFSGMKPLHVGHHPLLTDAAGEKISKSTGIQTAPLPTHAAAFRATLFSDFLEWTGQDNPLVPLQTPADLLSFFVEKDSAG